MPWLTLSVYWPWAHVISVLAVVDTWIHGVMTKTSAVLEKWRLRLELGPGPVRRSSHARRSIQSILCVGGYSLAHSLIRLSIGHPGHSAVTTE